MERSVVLFITWMLLFNIPLVSADSGDTIYIVHNEADGPTAEKLADYLDNYVHVEQVPADQWLSVAHKPGIKVILGGPDAYDGIGEIVESKLPIYLTEKLRTQDDATICYKTEAFGEPLYIIAGHEREETLDGLEINQDKDAFDSRGEVLLGTNPEMSEIPKSYKSFILDLFNDNPEWAREAAQKSICLEDGKLTSLEKNALKSPTEYEKNNSALVDYYLGELNKKFPDITKEIKKLPNYQKAEAIEDLTYLFLNGNTDVKKAGELILEGGTPDKNDYTYSVPSYNTELQALHWLAQDNEFDKNDTTAMAIAMDSGLIITLGDSSVDNRVRSDNTTMLDFARDIYGWQEYYGMPCLKNYPLEAKIAWAWRGHSTLYQDFYKGHLFRSKGNAEREWESTRGGSKVSKKMNIGDYNYIFVTPETLREMHKYFSQKKDWLNKDVKNLALEIEGYFFMKRWDAPKDIKWGENAGRLNVNENWEKFQDGIRPQGVCGDMKAFHNACCKSVGISELPIGGYHLNKSDGATGHFAYLFFDGEKWKGTKKQWIRFEKGIEKSGTDRFNLNIYTTVEPEGTSNKLGG